MQNLNNLPKEYLEAYLQPVDDVEMMTLFPTLERFRRDDVDGVHEGPIGVGHAPFWIVQRRYGPFALALTCVRAFTHSAGGHRGCGATLKVSTQLYSWASSNGSGRPRAARNAKKLRVLSALSRLGGRSTAGAIAIEAGLDRNAVVDCLVQGQRAKSPYAVRGAEREVTVLGSSHYWSLTDRGRLWLRWAVSQGLLRGPKEQQVVSDG